MTKIMMMGDSWACGEWVHEKTGEDQMDGKWTYSYQVAHQGTAQYLREAGHQVISVAEGGSNNWAQVDRLQPYHAMQRDRDSGRNLRDADVVLWFTTDPLRDLKDSQPTTMADFQARPDSLLRGNMDTLRGIVGDRPVWIVGGVGVVPQWVQTRYPTWRVIVPDLVRWLIPGSVLSTVHLCRGWRYGDCDLDLLDHHEREEQRASSFLWRAEHRLDSDEHRYFWPDGYHPNRETHRRLTQELILPLL